MGKKLLFTVFIMVSAFQTKLVAIFLLLIFVHAVLFVTFRASFKDGFFLNQKSKLYAKITFKNFNTLSLSLGEVFSLKRIVVWFFLKTEILNQVFVSFLDRRGNVTYLRTVTLVWPTCYLFVLAHQEIKKEL